MQKSIFFLLLLSATCNFSQVNPTKEISSEVDEAIVFLESAQITRKKRVTVDKGITILKFIGLSPFIDGKSIQVQTSNNVEIQAVSFEKNYLSKQAKNTDLRALENLLAMAKKELTLEKTLLNINNEETTFLLSNKVIGGNNQTVTNLMNTATYYGASYKALKLSALKIQERIDFLYTSIDDLSNQIGNFSSKKEYASGEAIIKIKAFNTSKIELVLVYNVSNAGWFPTYDIRVKDINSRLNLVYKANVKQQTKVDWINVKLSFSSSEPSTSSETPNLKPYFLSYNSVPPVYTKRIKTVSGIVSDQNGTLPGVNVLIEGTTVGTETNFDGRYAISVPENAGILSFSYLGYKTARKTIYNSYLNVQLEEDNNSLDEVVVIAYGNKSISSRLKGTVAGVQIQGSSSIVSDSKYSIPTTEIINQTSVNFEIEAAYTLKSNNKNYTVGMKTYEMEVDYQYYSIPKIDKNAYLIAYALDWEKLNLLEGEAAIYFEDTYIGKSLIDTRFIAEKLKISLGKDKNISIQREKTKEYTTKQFIGTKKEENTAWNITVKNNKSQKINISISDQIPVSTLEEIKVQLADSTTGAFNEETGEILWNLNLAANSSKNLQLRYAVKYPKDKNVILD
jgi:hypothetical protein